MAGKVSCYLAWIYMIFICVVLSAKAEMFVYSVQGSPTLSMGSYLEDIPIEAGMYLDPLMKVKVDDSNYIRVYCGGLAEPVKVIAQRRIKTLCVQKTELGVMRNDAGLNFPIIISPRKSPVCSLDQIEWGCHKIGKHRLTIKEFGGGKTIVDETLDAKKGAGKIEYYNLGNSKKQLKAGRKYSILIENLETGRKSTGNDSFKGVIQMTSEPQLRRVVSDLKELKRIVGNKALENYFVAIYMRNQNYLADSTYLLRNISSGNMLHHQLLQVKNAQSEGVPVDYMIQKWMVLLAAAIKADNRYVSAMTCVEIRKIYHELSGDWNKMFHNKVFKQYCDLSDLK